ncbi:MAG: thioredoxin family protein [Burkholderiales bacterium]|nr:thioredoxin family protein [Burkholderiales bacterium]
MLFFTLSFAQSFRWRFANLLQIATVFIAICALPTGAAAQFSKNSAGTVVQTEQVRAELVAHAPDGIGPGKTIWVGLQLAHQPHWHTYWKNAGDSGLPTKLEWTLPAGVTAGDIAWPAPQKIAIGNLANFGYEGTVLLPVPLTIARDFQPASLSDDLEVKLFASWLVCRQECVPQEGHFVLRIPLRGSTALLGAAFDAARAAQPKPFAGPAVAAVAADGVTFTVHGLPAAWHGKPLNLFPETTEIIETAAAPSATRPAGQGWNGAVWTARVPLSAQRTVSPTVLPIVLSLGADSVVTDARVDGIWPAVAEPGIVSPALQAALDANTRSTPPAVATSLAGWLFALLAAVLGGLILNLMPCVFPVLAIKMLGFAQHSGTHRYELRAQGLAYTAGVVLSFLALGGLMLALRAGGEQLGWGFQLQSPGVIAALALLFTLIGLNLVGLLEMGTILPSGLATLQLRHPLGDAFLTGVLAVAIASPCTAPFMGASLGYAIALPAAQALGIFAALGLGLALPYLAATWVPAVAHWLPKPGAWMVTLRTFMAFPMWATVVWLVWVLGHLSGVDGAASLLALLLMVALVVWALNLPGRGGRAVAIISIAVFALLAGAIGQNVFKIEDTPLAPPGSQTAGGTSWQAWAPGRVEAELAAGKPVFVDFTAAWCITCQVNKKTTLANAGVQADFAAKGVTLLRADWTRRDPAITQALEALGRSGVPVYVLYQAGRPPVVLSEILGVGELRAAIKQL